ncbi:MAG: hypoxanthine phosphoribosyltransferase [Bacilli bacterium]|jgi:hypoxanthine phosphoribosyltransferase
MHPDIEKVMISEAQIKTAVIQLGKKITADYQDKDLIVIGILKGAAPFMMDLVLQINLPLVMDFMQVASYHGTRRGGKFTFKKYSEMDVKDKHVLLVDDIVDSARTTINVIAYFLKKEAASVEVACLLDKPAGRKHEYQPKYIGFEIENEFVVGYGLDYQERYRNLPFIGVLKPEIYSD